MWNISQKFVALLVLVCFFSDLGLASSKAKLVLTAKDYAITSDASFSAYDKINGTVILSAPLAGVHKLEAIWVGPNNQQNHFKTTVDFSQQPRQTLSVWLNLGSEGGLLSSLRGQESDNSIYGGHWQVRVLLDGSEIATEKFLVN